MTVIDRAHRIVLILLMTTIPAIFLVDFVAEVFQGEITFSPGWQVYLALVAIAGRQIVKRQWEADWIIVGGGLGTAAMDLISYYLSPTVIDLTAAIVLVPVVGLVAVAVSRRAPVVTGAVLGVAAVVLSTIAFVDEGLAIDDIITKAAAVAILFGLGGWLLYQLRRGYEEQYAARDRFVAAVSHELRTPLTALAGFAELLADGQGDDEIATLIEDQARDAVNIVEDLLVAARSDAGQVTVAVTATDVAAEVSNVLDGISNTAESKSVNDETTSHRGGGRSAPPAADCAQSRHQRHPPRGRNDLGSLERIRRVCGDRGVRRRTRLRDERDGVVVRTLWAGENNRSGHGLDRFGSHRIEGTGSLDGWRTECHERRWRHRVLAQLAAR